MILIQLWKIITRNTNNIDPLSNEEEIATYGLHEVMESDAGFWVPPSELKNIAFVCHINDLKSDRYGCLNGIFNMFFV